jgi:hypothetical protein
MPTTVIEAEMDAVRPRLSRINAQPDANDAGAARSWRTTDEQRSAPWASPATTDYLRIEPRDLAVAGAATLPTSLSAASTKAPVCSSVATICWFGDVHHVLGTADVRRGGPLQGRTRMERTDEIMGGAKA